jgi:uncharacterized protein (UPF0276 family)
MRMSGSYDFRRPDVPLRFGLGVGMDLPWAGNIGFESGELGDDVTPRMKRFFEKHARGFSHLFFSFQPKNRNVLSPREYEQAYSALIAAAEPIAVRGFHHTLLNTGTIERYDKGPIIEFTNALIEKYDFRWIVEDLGIWTVAGKILPYPIPAIHTPAGLEIAIRNVREYQERLLAPLSVEFPGFSEGATFVIGCLDAFEFFARVVRETGSPATIDIGHILSYQWLLGRTGPRRFEGLERLPLENCFEIHLSGCQVTRQGKFRDLHHGILLDEQIELLEYLLPACPSLAVITYEDPKYTEDGELVPKSLRNYQRLAELVQRWKRPRPS